MLSAKLFIDHDSTLRETVQVSNTNEIVDTEFTLFYDWIGHAVIMNCCCRNIFGHK